MTRGAATNLLTILEMLSWIRANVFNYISPELALILSTSVFCLLSGCTKSDEVNKHSPSSQLYFARFTKRGLHGSVLSTNLKFANKLRFI